MRLHGGCCLLAGPSVNLDVLLCRWTIEAAYRRCHSSLMTTALTWTTCPPLCCPWLKMWIGRMSRAAFATLHRWVAMHGGETVSSAEASWLGLLRMQ